MESRLPFTCYRKDNVGRDGYVGVRHEELGTLGAELGAAVGRGVHEGQLLGEQQGAVCGHRAAFNKCTLKPNKEVKCAMVKNCT